MNRSGNAVRARDYEITAEEYLAFEREAFEKHEFINGEIVAMAGASEKHNIISINLVIEIGSQLKKTDCRAFASDMRVKAGKTKKSNYYYPDLVIICGQREYDDEQKDVLLNPNVIIEILSKSTKLKDRNEKFDVYMSMETISDYVLVEQDEMRIEHYSRIDAHNWNVRLLNDESQNLSFETFNCTVSLKDIYNDINFKKPAQKRKTERKSKVN